MKLLFDENISWRIKKKLAEHFEVKHVSDISKNLISDSDIWEYAKKNKFTIVTFDEDFFDIQMLNNYPPKIIWLRFGNTKTHKIAKILINSQNKIKLFIEDKNQGVFEMY